MEQFGRKKIGGSGLFHYFINTSYFLRSDYMFTLLEVLERISLLDRVVGTSNCGGEGGNFEVDEGFSRRQTKSGNSATTSPKSVRRLILSQK